MVLMRVYKPYWKWEDYQNGMWRKVSPQEEKKFLDWAIVFTSDHKKYGKAMSHVIELWTETMLHNLTNQSINRRAFLGHCACCYESGCPEYIVRRAWKELTEQQRVLADNEAEIRIDNWINEYKTNSSGLRSNVGTQMLLEWHTR